MPALRVQIPQVWAYNTRIVDGSVKSMRGFNFLGAGFAVVGTSAFAVMAWLAIDVRYLVVMRIVIGIGLGIFYLAGRFFINRTAHGREIAELNTTWALWFVFGLGFGPSLAAGENAIFRAVCGFDVPVGKGPE